MYASFGSSLFDLMKHCNFFFYDTSMYRPSCHIMYAFMLYVINYSTCMNVLMCST